MSQFAWDDAPGPAPKARVVKLPPGKSQLIVLGPARGLWVHWKSGRTLPCDGESCPRSLHRFPCHWTGYCPCAFLHWFIDEQDHGKRKPLYEPVVLPVNQDQAEQIHLGSFPSVLEVEKKDGERGYKLCKIDPIKANGKLPEAFDVEPTLFRVFGRRPPRPNGEGETNGPS